MRSGRRTYFQSGAYYNLKLLLEMLLRRQVRPSLWGSTRAASQTRSHDLRGCEWERCDFGGKIVALTGEIRNKAI